MSSTRVSFPLLLLLLSLVQTACVPDSELTDPDVTAASAPTGEVNTGDQLLPEGFVVPPGSELERRIEGECIPFDPWGDGREVCVMSTPQNGTLGRLGPEDELARADDEEVGGARAELREAPSTLPARVDHRAQYLDGCTTVSNQQTCGWCVVHAATAVLEALHCSKGCDVPELSEAHLRSNSLGGEAFGSCAYGWNTTHALQTLVDDPIVDNATWPYIANGRGLNNNRPSEDALDMAAYQPTGYHDVDLSDLDEVKAELASEREVIIAVPVFSANSRAGGTRGDWWSSTADVQVPPTESPCGCNESTCMDAMCLRGYHAVVLTGYDDATQKFQFLNSWGKGWGDGGYGTMDYAFLTKYGYSGGALDDVNTDLDGNSCEDEEAMDEDAGGGDSADGGMPMPSDACAAAGDCATCAALSGCGWCEGSGCQADSSACSTTMHTETCPAAGDPCAVHSDCGSCVAAEGCDWCGDSSRNGCFSPALRTVACNDARNAADQCNDCGMGTTCGDCADIEGCGWCPGSSVGVVAPGSTAGSCVLGSDASADRVTCGGTYRGTEAMCRPEECSRITDCGECLDTAGCGWCDGTDQCMPGGFWGPSGTEDGSTCGDDYDYFGVACDNTEASCGGAESCRECLRNATATCEWDESSGACGDPMMSTGSDIISDEEECPGICNGPFATCGTADDCCEGLSCVNNDCVDCDGAGGVGESCDPTVANACCGTLVCGRATGGGNTCCKSDTDNCESDSECCGDMTCDGGQCACRASGESCQSGRECCGSSFCDDGVCT